MQNKAELIFMKWKAELVNMDRSRSAVEGNFELLFDEFIRAKIQMQEALPYLDRAIKAHYPSEFVIKHTYKRVKTFSCETIKEFETSWKELIASAAKRAFFSFYEIDGVAEKVEKSYGNMSASEYRRQQKYADAHPTLDWESLIKERELELASQTEEITPNLDSVKVDIDLGEL